jgi:tripartite-type tricarboxylate transporter receptor subunit TctC
LIACAVQGKLDPGPQDRAVLEINMTIRVPHWRALVFATSWALGVLGASHAAQAQSYPSNIIRMIVPSPAGTPPDIMGRLMANELGEAEGWRVIVENKVGAIQTIGLAEALKQPADGYTLASIALPASAAPALIPNVSFKLDTDFVPVIKLASAYHILVVTPSVPAKSLPEFVAWLKSNPDKTTFSSGGFGTPAHLAGETFKLQTGVKTTHVPYQGLTQAIADLMTAGHAVDRDR